jgi:phage protein U
MCLGDFVFELHTLPYQNLQRQRAWRHPSNARVGLRPARQFIGPDDETITLSGMLLPELAGDALSLNEICEMADEGDAHVLIDGMGELWGRYVIESVDETQTVFFDDGAPRQIDFTLKLARVDDGDFTGDEDEDADADDFADEDEDAAEAREEAP